MSGMSPCEGEASIGTEDERRWHSLKLPPLEQLHRFKGHRVLILSPHPDDAVMGCGGTLRTLSKIGCSILAIFMTDGRYGCPSMVPEEVARIRRLETINAANVLGIDNLQFLDHPDRGLRCDPPTIGEVKDAIDTYAPTLLLTTHASDPHPDHKAAFKIAQAASAGSDLALLQYEVLSPLRSDVVIDVTAAMDAKERSIREHRSQMEAEDLITKIRGLNAFRSLGRGANVRYCEAFARQH